MAKNKKKVLHLVDRNLSFSTKDTEYKIIAFNPNTMEVEVSGSTSSDAQKRVQKLPFAHLPKELKKLIKPN